MTTYRPILKGKPAEFKAWRNATTVVATTTEPLFECAPNHGLDRDLTVLANALGAGWPLGAAVATVDSGYLPQGTPVAGSAHSAIMWLAHELGARSVPYRPVVRIDDGPLERAEAARAAAMHGQGVCLRLGDADEDPDTAAADVELPGLLTDLGLTAADVHLLLDYWAVESAREVARIVPVTVAALNWADAKGPWASVTVASGAFPSSVSGLPLAQPVPLLRHDAHLWRDLAAATHLPFMPDYGDYAVNHPAMPLGGRAPLPNLRYTVDRQWIVWREQKALPGNESFFTVCGGVTSLPGWSGPGFSWGDAEIARCSGSTGGAGTATEWRAYGTSHHLSTVIDRLTTLGEP